MLNMLVASGLCLSIFIGDGVFLPQGIVYLQFSVFYLLIQEHSLYPLDSIKYTLF